MKKAVLSNRIYLSRTDELHHSLMESLTYRLPPQKLGMPYEYYTDVTRVNQNILTIPIGRQDLIPDDYEIEDKRVEVPAEFPEFKFELRESQQDVLDSVTESCIINANPSWGKTFSGIAIAAKLGQKTLVVVHTANLREQWIKEIKKTLGIEAGEIGGGKFKTNQIIVVATMQSLRTRMDKVIKAYGTIILDECHHLPATAFKSVLDACRAKYKIGLSATLWRRDGKHVMLNDYTGIPTFKPKDENRLQCKVLVVDTDIAFNSDSNVPWAHRVNELMDKPEYLELVLNIAEQQAALGYKVLVVSDRVEFLETCQECLPEFKLITGQTKDREVNMSEIDGIFGSIKIFSEGINIPELSCLILATPFNNRALLKQVMGRIERPHKGKKDPITIDLALTGRVAKKQLAGRISYYAGEDYAIKYV